MRIPLHLFRRVVGSGALLPELDGLRALAILPVVWFHASLSIYLKGGEGQASLFGGDPFTSIFGSPIGWIASHGFLGVQLFFAISGFVVTLPFARAAAMRTERPSLRRFYLKRLTRIEPPYAIALATYLLGVWLVAPENARVADYLAGLLYLRTALFGSEPWAFFISWSLEIEVQFYLLAPLFASIFLVRRAGVRRGLLVLGIVLGALHAGSVRRAGVEPAPLGGPLQHGSWLGPELCFFLTGMLVADLRAFRGIGLAPSTALSERAREEGSVAWDVGFLAGTAGALVSYAVLERTVWGGPLLAGSILLVLLGGLRSRFARRLLASGPLVAIGGACYTIYLFHFLAVSLFGRFLAPLASMTLEWNLLAIALPFALAVTLGCLALFPFVERPFMFADWPRTVAKAVRMRQPRILLRLLAER
jgi:peptidoglycan/LPS O-acetylase OafA/YrhL